jgi:uncharacterized repeat protein (TIGR01451 family)
MSTILSEIKLKRPSLKWVVLITIFGLLLSQVIFPLLVYAQQTLYVDISANPSSGSAPLYDVDLTATVSGSATGDITYRFDCTNNGSWERTITTSSTSYTASDLCDYTSTGNYTAKISVERGGLVFQGTTAIFVSGGSDLSVNLYISPSSGSAPLYNVDLTATVSGSATGDIIYHFDCTNDGSWERTITTSATSYTATDICSYPSAGSYTASVSVERGGLSFKGTAGITVYGSSGGNTLLSISKLARNLTKGEAIFSQTISANPGDNLEFYIAVNSNGSNNAENVVVSDILPSRITYNGDVRVDGNPMVGVQNIAYGINVGSLTPGQTKIIIFEGQISSTENFGFGMTTLINTGMATGNNISSVTSTSQINVTRTQVAGAATSVSTGITDYLYPYLLLISLLSFLLYVLFSTVEKSQNRILKKVAWKYYQLRSFVLPRR